MLFSSNQGSKEMLTLYDLDKHLDRYKVTKVFRDAETVYWELGEGAPEQMQKKNPYKASIAYGEKVPEELIKKINDSDHTGRGTVGGVDKLVSVNVDVESDETSPKQLQVQLFINNSYGEQIYSTSETMKLNFKSEEGKIEAASGRIQKFFLLDVQDCYGFHVEVFPDAPIDRTTLKVRDGARTRTGVDVIHIHSDAT